MMDGMRVLNEILVKRGFVLCTMQEKQGGKETNFETNRMLWPTGGWEVKDVYNIDVWCSPKCNSKTDRWMSRDTTNTILQRSQNQQDQPTYHKGKTQGAFGTPAIIAFFLGWVPGVFPSDTTSAKLTLLSCQGPCAWGRVGNPSSRVWVGSDPAR